MLYDVLAILFGSLLGFLVTWRFVEIGVKKEEGKSPKFAGVSQLVEEKREPLRKPKDLEELVKYVATKYMLAEITILTPEGLPIVSNSSTVDEDVASAPEMLRVANRLLNSDRLVISSGDVRIVVLHINPEVILHAKVMRELSKTELEKMKTEINDLLEEMI
jgi:hypothetical protein